MGSPDMLFGVCLIIGIVMVFLGALFIALCMPLASGRVRSRDYNNRPLNLTKIMPDERDMADRKASKWVIVWAVFVIAMGLGAIWIGLTKNSGPFNLSTSLMLLAFYIVPIVLLLLITIGAYAYIQISRRKHHS
jgi:magnesium-transporting ATPase (P-type)